MIDLIIFKYHSEIRHSDQSLYSLSKKKKFRRTRTRLNSVPCTHLCDVIIQDSIQSRIATQDPRLDLIRDSRLVRSRDAPLLLTSSLTSSSVTQLSPASQTRTPKTPLSVKQYRTTLLSVKQYSDRVQYTSNSTPNTTDLLSSRRLRITAYAFKAT